MTSKKPLQKILVADDSLTVRMEIKELLEPYGYQVQLAQDGRQCLDLLEKDRPDIILLDVLMPDLDGIEVCRTIKTDSSLKDIPVVILTAMGEVQEKVRGFQAGAEDYLVKPFVEKELLARIAAHIKSGELLRQLKTEVTERTQAEAALQKAHDELEGRVKERTVELVKANEELQWEIGERRRAEEALRQSERELRTRNQIAQTFLTSDEEEIYGEVLSNILAALGSVYGVFGYIDEEGSLACPSMTRDIWDQCQVPDKDISFPRESWGGIWGRALTEKRTLLSNEPLPVPEGHVPIQRVLVVPIMHQGKVIGILEVANKVTDYDEKDIQLLEAIANYIAPALNARLQRDRQERERRWAEERQKLAAQILGLLNQHSERTDVIRDILALIHESTGFEAVGIRLQADSDFPYYETTGFPPHFVQAECYLCALDADGEIIRDANGVPVLEGTCGNVIQGRVDPSLSCFTESGSFWTNSTTELLASTTEEERQARTRNRCNIEGYESVALIPLHSGDKTIGLLQLNDRRKGMFTPEMISYFEDIGASIGISLERKRAEEELKQHREHLEELVKERTDELVIAREQALEARRIAESNAQAAEAANRAKSAFLAHMSHELRTPLNAILGYAQIFQRRPSLGSDVIDGLNIVQQSGEHLLTLITDILDLSKIEAGKMELSPTLVHFPSFLDHIASIIHSRAEAKGLTFSFERLSTLPSGVQADETRLRQVLLNLLDNAVKFTEQGEVVLSVGVCEHESKGREQPTEPLLPTPRFAPLHRFEVQDTGIGIPPDQLELIFQPFEQVRDVTRQTKGTGLGLAISRELVRLMGGELQVESESGRGSTFWFEVALPVTEVAVEADRPPEQIISGYKGPQRTVLVVDDVPSNRAVIIDLLKSLGFDVIEAADGLRAIHLAQELRPDLILMDRWMPVMDGVEAVRRMRHTPELAAIPVIAISASVSKEDQARSREVGFDAFLPKPLDWSKLVALLQEHLELEWESLASHLPSPAVPGTARQGTWAPPGAPLVPPAQDEMAVLYDLALQGDMRGIWEWAAHVETLGEQYVPLANKLRELVKGFEEREILTLVEQYMEDDNV